MSELGRIEARIRALSQIREVVRAMRGVASSRLRESEHLLDATGRYREILAEAHARIRAARATLSPAANGAPVLIVTSEHGFVGPLGRHIAAEARARLPAGTRPWVVGRRGAAFLEEAGFRLQGVLAQAGHPRAVVRRARELRAALGRPARLRLLHPRPTLGGFEIGDEVIPAPPGVRAGRGRPPLPRTHLPVPALEEALAEELVLAGIVHALAAAFAVETAMRLRTCEQASRNIERRSEELAHLKNRLRQEAITEELLDLVAGAEAVMRSG